MILATQVKCRAMEIAELIQSEDGVVAAVDAFHHHLPPELPIPPPSIEEQELASPLQWVLLQIEKWCCLPCGLRL